MSAPRALSCAVLITTFNRRETTLRCLGQLRAQRQGLLELEVVLVDDASDDGTADAVREHFPETTTIDGAGELWWAGAMAIAEDEALRRNPDLILWLNDDVELDPDALERLSNWHSAHPGAILANSLRDPDSGRTSYGGRVQLGRHPQSLHLLPAADSFRRVDGFNGNVVLIPRSAYLTVGRFDGAYRHQYADFDYALRARRAGIEILLTPGTIGACRPNTSGHSADSPRMSLRETWRHLQSPKGMPLRNQVRYLRRHGGPEWPAYLIYGYAKRLLLGRA